MYAVLGDIINSKLIKNRETIQRKFYDVLNEINEKYECELIKPLSITLGDEFQGVFKRFDKILEIIKLISIKMNPTKFRFGIGVGELLFDYSKDKMDPFNTDGNLWWNAREAIQLVKLNESKPNVTIYSNIAIVTNDEFLNNNVNEVLNLLKVISTYWTEKQIEIINLAIINYGITEELSHINLSEISKVTNSAIQKRLKRSNYNNYVKGVNVINKMMGA